WGRRRAAHRAGGALRVSGVDGVRVVQQAVGGGERGGGAHGLLVHGGEGVLGGGVRGRGRGAGGGGGGGGVGGGAGAGGGCGRGGGFLVELRRRGGLMGPAPCRRRCCPAGRRAAGRGRRGAGRRSGRRPSCWRGGRGRRCGACRRRPPRPARRRCRGRRGGG